MLEINLVNCESIEYKNIIEEALLMSASVIENYGSINVVLMNNSDIRRYNKDFRDKDYATDVLSFVDGNDNHLGDLLISLEKCEEQRIEYEHSFKRELSFLVIHGYLHLSGYDHMTQEEEIIMFKEQNKILDKLKITR